MSQVYMEGLPPQKSKTVIRKDFSRRPDSWFAGGEEQLTLGAFRTPDTAAPLWYVGAKYHLYDLLTLELLPKGTTEIVSPFMGGASLELRLAASGIHVHAYDLFLPVAEFYQVFNANSAAVVDKVLEIYPIYRGDEESHAEFMRLARYGGWAEIECPIERAAVTWAISRQSYMGKNFASTPVDPKYASRIEYFRNPIIGDGPVRRQHRIWREWHNPNITFGHADYHESLAKHDCIAYLDPPYVKKSRFYGNGKQGEFDHEELRDVLAARGRFILSYGDDPLIRELYKDFTIMNPEWRYACGKSVGDTKSSEILILSPDIG